jgi:hypothetical protein
MEPETPTMSTPEQRVIHCAIAWRETEKSAIGAPEGEKSTANERHSEAKRNLRKAVDHLTRGKP